MQGAKVRAQGAKVRAQGAKVRTEGAKVRTEGAKIRASITPVGKGCSHNIQLQPPPPPTRTNTAQCSKHCNLRKGTQISYKPLRKLQ